MALLWQRTTGKAGAAGRYGARSVADDARVDTVETGNWVAALPLAVALVAGLASAAVAAINWHAGVALERERRATALAVEVEKDRLLRERPPTPSPPPPPPPPPSSGVGG